MAASAKVTIAIPITKAPTAAIRLRIKIGRLLYRGKKENQLNAFWNRTKKLCRASGGPEKPPVFLILVRERSFLGASLTLPAALSK